MNDNMTTEGYFASGLAYLTGHRLFNKGVLPKELRDYIYHLLMLFRIQLMVKSVPRFNSHKATEYALELISQLSDPKECKEIFESSANLIESTLRSFTGATGGNPPSGALSANTR